MKNETFAIKYTQNGLEQMSFGELLQANHVSVSELADWCMISRQTIYKYINGMTNPNNLTYINVTQIATYLDETPMVVYNSICHAFESIHDFNEETGKWE